MAKEQAKRKREKPLLTILMEETEYEAIKAIAASHKRSMASYVRDVLIHEDIKRHARGSQNQLPL